LKPKTAPTDITSEQLQLHINQSADYQ